MSLPSLRESIGALLGLVFRSRCELCRRECEETICPECASAFEEVPDWCCSICGNPLKERSKYDTCWSCHKERPAFTRLRSLWVYEDPLRTAITSVKFPRPRVRRRELADALLGVVEIRLKSRGNPLPGFRIEDAVASVVLPVPMRPERKQARGFSLPEDFARLVSETWSLPLALDALSKSRKTPPQVRLAREDRLRNVKGSFMVPSPDEINEKICLVVDDVATTGATLSECAQTLKEAGAKRVYALTLARQP